MAETAIEWCTHVWNPVTGCDRVSPGCANCYALTYAGRLKAMGQPKYQRDGGRASGPGFGVTCHDSELAAPARWRKPRRVFVNSMSDLFHEDVPSEFIDRLFEAMRAAPRHDFLILTKRPERMRDYMLERTEPAGCVYAPWLPLPNVWLGVSIENRRFIHRADLLRETPAAVRFISAEPLLGPLVKTAATTPDTPRVERPARGGVRCRNCGRPMGTWQWQCAYADCARERWPDGHRGPELDLTGIDWLIVGGESGQHIGQAPHRFLVDEHGQRREDRAHWVRDLRDACEHSETAFFFKQWGGRTPKAGGRALDGRTWDEMPQVGGAGDAFTPETGSRTCGDVIPAAERGRNEGQAPIAPSRMTGGGSAASARERLPRAIDPTATQGES